MENYTPLSKELLNGNTKKEGSPFSTILLLMATITAFILAILLFILIQRKIKDQKQVVNSPSPTISVEPTEIVEPTIEIPTPTNIELSPTSSPNSSVEISPTISLVPTDSDSTESGITSP